MPANKGRLVIFGFLLLALLALLVWLAISSGLHLFSAATAQQAPAAKPFWIDLNMQPALADWFNQTALPGDMARADQLGQISWLEDVSTRRKLVVFKSAAIAEQLVPKIADKFQILGYNLEHGPLNPLDEQADPVGSIKRMRALADRYGMQLALGPDHDFALSHGAALAPYVDIFVMQVQRVQTQPEMVRDFVVPLAAQVRQANPKIQTSMQVRTEGDVGALVAMIESLHTSLDGVSILTSRETTETAKALVTALRPELAQGQATGPGQLTAPQQPKSGLRWFFLMPLVTLGTIGGVVAGVMIGIAATLVWANLKR